MNAAAVREEISKHSVHSGFLLKKTKFFNEWRKRWVVVTQNFIFTFKDQPHAKPSDNNNHNHQLTEYIEIRNIKALKSFLHPYNSSRSYVDEEGSSVFRIDSSDTTFHFKALQIRDKWAWLEAIETTVTNTRQILPPSFQVEFLEALPSNTHRRNTVDHTNTQETSGNTRPTIATSVQTEAILLYNPFEFESDLKPESQNQWTQTYEEELMRDIVSNINPTPSVASMKKSKRKVLVSDNLDNHQDQNNTKMHLVRAFFDEYGSILRKTSEAEEERHLHHTPEAIELEGIEGHGSVENLKELQTEKLAAKHLGKLAIQYLYGIEELGLKKYVLLELRAHRDRKGIVRNLISEIVSITTDHLLQEWRSSHFERSTSSNISSPKSTRSRNYSVQAEEPENKLTVPEHILKVLRMGLSLFHSMLAEPDIEIGKAELQQMKDYAITILETSFIKCEDLLELLAEVLVRLKDRGVNQDWWADAESRKVKRVRSLIQREISNDRIVDLLHYL